MCRKVTSESPVRAVVKLLDPRDRALTQAESSLMRYCYTCVCERERERCVGSSVVHSGFFLTLQEILASVMIKNLDTGEEIPLNQAEEKLPAGINPLTLHIMRRTKEYITYD